MTDDKEVKQLPAVTQDPVIAAIERERLIAKRQRQSSVGALLDKAAQVLTDVLDTTDAANAEMRMRAAETAVKLYTEQGKLDVADETLRLKEQQLELERQKLSAPGGPLFQQNNLYIGGQPAPAAVGTTDDEQAALLLRKKAQDAVLQSFLPQSNQGVDEQQDVADAVLDSVSDLNSDAEDDGE